MSSYIFQYNPKWADWYVEESDQIRKTILIEINLYHIGSTAVPNMHAKECIDILGEINDYDEGKNIIKPLESLGYEYRGEYEIEARHYFSKYKNRKVHLHVFPKGHCEIDKHLHFVDVMSKNPELVEEFVKIKKELFELYPQDRSGYQEEKKFFYEKVAKIEFSP